MDETNKPKNPAGAGTAVVDPPLTDTPSGPVTDTPSGVVTPPGAPVTDAPVVGVPGAPEAEEAEGEASLPGATPPSKGLPPLGEQSGNTTNENMPPADGAVVPPVPGAPEENKPQV